jgi:hypothetical protein
MVRFTCSGDGKVTDVGGTDIRANVKVDDQQDYTDTSITKTLVKKDKEGRDVNKYFFTTFRNLITTDATDL